MIKHVLIPFMLAWILLERTATLLFTVRDQLVLLRPTLALVHRDLRESGLISLPTEVLYVIVKELVCLPPETAQTGDSQYPVLAFSQVCRRLREISLQNLFKKPPPLTLSHLTSRFEGLKTASNIGRYVHRLSISPVTQSESILSSIIDCLVRLTVLTVIYLKGDVHQYSQLIPACCRRTSLKALHVEEADLDMTVTPTDPGESAPGYFVDHLVQAILGVDDLCLERFAHIASLPLHPSTFLALRARATHLQNIALRTSIQSNLRVLFNQPTQWASASKLKQLVIRTCAGVHLGALAVHVANGVFGQLQRLRVIRSGYDDDSWFEAATRPPTWTIGVLERLDVDHADEREVTALSIIHVQEVYATRCFTAALVDALNAGGWPGLHTVHTHCQGNGSEALSLGLRQACDARSINILTDAVPYGNCNCHIE